MNRHFHKPNSLGLVLGAVLASLTFGPSLLPRAWLTQGCLNLAVFALGYSLGALLSRIPVLAKIELDSRLRKAAYVLLLGLYLLAAYLGWQCQQASRVLISLPPNQAFWATPSVLFSLLSAVVLVILGRIMGSAMFKVGTFTVRKVPKVGRVAIVLLIAALVIVGPIRSTLLHHLAESINSKYQAKNTTTEAGIEQPEKPEFSGSLDSLIPWSSLGLKGRTFVASTPPPEILESFHGTPPQVPIRIYAGLESAPSVKERAELAVRDLVRAGGFERKVLVVITTTGTGWVDENGPVPIEYMYNGDSALVALQYSYLPSVFSFLTDSHKARAAGKELFDAVYQEWSLRPEHERPLLLSFGESLGSFGAEAAFPTAEEFRKRCQGALLVGPPHVNPIRTEAVAHRKPGTPAVLPIVNDGRTVRFAMRASDFNLPQGEWEHPRAVYLQNSSDPIVWWSPRLLFSKPDWLREKRGPDVEPRMTWFPLVTFLQVSADYLEARAPAGHGHRYGTLPVVAWSKIAPPQDWTAEKTEQLRALLAQEK
jgi:uncharacterized membrane protein